MRVLLTFVLAAIVGCAAAAPRHAAEDAAVTARLLTPDGKPAAGAVAVLVPAGGYANVTNGTSFDDDSAKRQVTAGTDGRIRFPASKPPCLIVAIHETGS